MRPINVQAIYQELESLADQGPKVNLRLQAQAIRRTSRLLRVLPSNTAVGNAVLYVGSCFTVYFGFQGANFPAGHLQEMLRASLDALRDAISLTS